MAVHAESVELELIATRSDAARLRFRKLRRMLFAAAYCERPAGSVQYIAHAIQIAQKNNWAK